MSTYLTYYLQTNIVCIMFLIYILVSNRIDKEDSFINISMSIGVALGEVRNKDDYLKLLQEADEKMYENKAIHHAQ